MPNHDSTSTAFTKLAENLHLSNSEIDALRPSDWCTCARSTLGLKSLILMAPGPSGPLRSRRWRTRLTIVLHNDDPLLDSWLIRLTVWLIDCEMRLPAHHSMMFKAPGITHVIFWRSQGLISPAFSWLFFTSPVFKSLAPNAKLPSCRHKSLEHSDSAMKVTWWIPPIT